MTNDFKSSKFIYIMKTFDFIQHWVYHEV